MGANVRFISCAVRMGRSENASIGGIDEIEVAWIREDNMKRHIGHSDARVIV